MLEHSRSSTGIKEPSDINKLVDESLRLSYHAMRAKDKSFNSDHTMKLDESLGKINIIPQDLSRVLLNLFNNALYAVDQRNKVETEKWKNGEDSPVLSAPLVPFLPLVTVSTKNLGHNKVEIRISDNGIGIPESIKQKIFQPFFTTKPTGEGTGLGLSLSYNIITKGHGGTLEVVSSEGEGSEFIIVLP